jgi:high-affinity iron transporter
MLETLIVVFREGLEAFLIVAIMLAYVTKTGHSGLRKPIFAGIGLAALISVTTGWHVAELAQDPIWEGSLAMIAGALVASFTLYVMKTAQNIRSGIHESLEKKAQEEGALADIAVFAFTVLMVSREGMETALMLGTLSSQNDAIMMWLGAGLGAALVGVIAYLWASQSQRINLRLFLQVTGVFLVLFSVDLFLYGLHELSEMNAIPLIGDDMNTNFHIWTEAIETPLVFSDLGL